jgi:hypothetical protein
MKKNLLMLIIVSVMQTISTAQVDMSILKNQNTIWLFDAKTGSRDIWDGFAIMTNGEFLQYSRGQKPNKETGVGTNKYLRQAHLCKDLTGKWSMEYHFEGNKIVSKRSNYYWNITKLTDTEMIIQKGKMINPGVGDYYVDENVQSVFRLNRLIKTKKKYPFWFRDTGSGEGKYLRENNGKNNPFDDYVDFSK